VNWERWLPWNWLRQGYVRPAREVRTTWKIIRVKDEAIPEELNPADPGKMSPLFGVVVSTDTFLSKTQTLLYCPIVDTTDENGHPKTQQPWHVLIEAERADAPGLRFRKAFLSTKVMFPISLSEIDGVERGRITAESRAIVASRLREWLAQRA